MNDTTSFPPTRLQVSRFLVIAIATIATTLMSAIGPVAAAPDATATPGSATPVSVSARCDAIAPGVGAEAWIRSELYFGMKKGDGSTISDAEWQAFLDNEITPRFPDGLTVLRGYGQSHNPKGPITGSESIVVIIFHAPDTIAESSKHLEEIRDAFETGFDKKSALRVDSAPVCVSF